MTFISSHHGLRSGAALGCGAGVLLVGLAACSPYRAPVLSIGEISQVEESAQGVVLSFTLDARNENEVPLPLKEMRYSLELEPGEDWGGGEEGGASFSGVRSPEATLRANGTQQLVLPAAIALEPGAARPAGLVPYRFTARLVYITPGALAETLFDTGVRRPTVTFTKSGFIDFGEP